MAKNKGFDIIADAQERADHNINPYYWFNRVNSFTVAQWKTHKYLSSIWLLLNSAILIGWFIELNREAMEAKRTLFSVIFDFHDSFTSARFVGLVLLLAFWVIYGMGAMQSYREGNNRSSPAPVQPKREKKKKQPKRPKNYR